MAALRNGRRYIGIDLKDEYHDIARRRLTKAHYETAYGVRHERERVADGQLPMFGDVDVAPPPIVDKQGSLGKRTYTGFNARWKARCDGGADGD